MAPYLAPVVVAFALLAKLALPSLASADSPLPGSETLAHVADSGHALTPDALKDTGLANSRMREQLDVSESVTKVTSLLPLEPASELAPDAMPVAEETGRNAPPPVDSTTEAVSQTLQYMTQSLDEQLRPATNPSLPAVEPATWVDELFANEATASSTIRDDGESSPVASWTSLQTEDNTAQVSAMAATIQPGLLAIHPAFQIPLDRSYAATGTSSGLAWDARSPLNATDSAPRSGTERAQILSPGSSPRLPLERVDSPFASLAVWAVLFAFGWLMLFVSRQERARSWNTSLFIPPR